MNLTTPPHPVGKVKLHGNKPQLYYIAFLRGSVKLIKIIIQVDVSPQADPHPRSSTGCLQTRLRIADEERPHCWSVALYASIKSPSRDLAHFLQESSNVAQSWLSSRSCKKLIILFIQYYAAYSQTPVIAFLSGKSLHHSQHRLFVYSNLFALKIPEILRLTTEAKIPDFSQVQWGGACDPVKCMQFQSLRKMFAFTHIPFQNRKLQIHCDIKLCMCRPV
jgi:hypothetical protein